MTNFTRKFIVMTAATLLTATAVGCKSDKSGPTTKEADNRIFGEKFVSQEEQRDIHRMSAAQEASGARADATLHWFNFDKGALNTSGKQKLDAMLADDDSLPVTVFVDVPQDDFWTARNDAIAAYLKDHAVTAEQLKVVRGPNPDSYHPSAPGVASIKADSALGTAAVGSTETAGGSSMK